VPGERDACTRPILDQLEVAITGCNTERDSDVAASKIAFPLGPARDQCIDNAQVEAFMCKDDAREAAAPGLRQCQDAFQARPPAQ
jgi:hypothetical protein